MSNSLDPLGVLHLMVAMEMLYQAKLTREIWFTFIKVNFALLVCIADSAIFCFSLGWPTLLHASSQYQVSC